MKKIITYGTFDLFHYGHYNLLKRAKEMGDYLIVGVSSDEMCRKKGKIPILSQAKRMEIVGALRFVDQVILERTMEQKITDAASYEINTFVLGDDYREAFPRMPEYSQLLKQNVEVVFLERTPEISSSQIKQKLAREKALEVEYHIPRE